MDELRRRRRGEYNALVRTLRTVREISFQQAAQNEYIKLIRDKVWSLKVWTHQVRLLGCRIDEGLLTTHLVIKQQHSFDDADIDLAKERCTDWKQRQDR